MSNKRTITTQKICMSLLALVFLAGCSHPGNPSLRSGRMDTVGTILPKDSRVCKPIPVLKPGAKIETGTTSPAEVLSFAKTLVGIPYLYASTDPAKGFDCSGFITYVFGHFNIRLPRSSVDFTHVGKEINYMDARPGDLILFPGTDSTTQVVGHMGIVESNTNDSLQFIHSSSGKAKGVVITLFGNYYKGRFVKVIRIFPDRFFK